MKYFASMAIASIILLGSSSVRALDVPAICGDFEFFKNPETRVYRGQFEDGKGVTLDHVLIVAEVTDAGKALAFYVYGKQPKWKIKKPGCSPRIGSVDGDTLTLPLRRNRLTVTYVFNDDGTASVKYVSKRRDGSTRTTRGKVALEQ